MPQNHKIPSSNGKLRVYANLKGMHCASCAAFVEETLSKLAGISNCQVNYASEKLIFEYDPSLVSLETIETKLAEFGYTIVPIPSNADQPTSDQSHSLANAYEKEKQDKELALRKQRQQVQMLLPFAIFTFVAMLWEQLAANFSWMPDFLLSMAVYAKVSFLLASIVLFWSGTEFLKAIPRFIKTGQANMDTLVGIGTVTAYVYSTFLLLFPATAEQLGLPHTVYFDVTIVVISFVKLGKYLENNSKLRTSEAIEKLYNLQPKQAIVEVNNQLVEIPIEQVKIGDIVVVKPGSKIPVDGEVIFGNSTVDESMITGESIPMDVTVGSKVVAGTINQHGAFKMVAEKVGSDTLLANIIKLVEEAQGSKAPIQRLVDRVAAVFVPVVLIIAATTLILWLIIGSQYMAIGNAFSLGLICAVSILVIACPCALGLATPTAIIVGVGMGANAGILVKSAVSLEKLHSITTVVLDKTGTITHGKPQVVCTESLSAMTANEIIRIAASLERFSEHPLAQAIQNNAIDNKLELLPVAEFKSIEGKGIVGIINNQQYYVGNTALLEDYNLDYNHNQVKTYGDKGMTVVFVADTRKVLGFIVLADIIKPSAKEAIAELHKLGIEVIILTGDNQGAAQHIANEVGVDRVIAQVLPAQKAEHIKELKKPGRFVAMVGDGINDAPAIASADVGIAMGTGTDIAMESADVILIHGDLTKLVKAIKLSYLTIRKIKQNLFWAFFYNVIGIPLAAGLLYPITGWLLNPGVAGAAMAFSSVSVVTNTLLMKNNKI